MDNIKVRAWHEESRIMIYDTPARIFKWLEEGQPIKIMLFSGLYDNHNIGIYERDVVYLAGYGLYIVEFPFIQLYEASWEGDIESIRGNIYETLELVS